MADTKIIKAIHEGNFGEAHNLLEKALYKKAGLFLEEKKKHVVAKTWNRKKVLSEADEKSIFASSRRKAFREKMKELVKVKGNK